MPRYRKKPVVIDAVQWTGSNFWEVAEMTGLLKKGHCSFEQVPNGRLSIETLEGRMTADVGDWIIKGIKGEFYPCKPDIFAATYEEVADGQSE